MFTGIIEEIGRVRRVVSGRSGEIAVDAEVVTQGTKVGDSIAVNGVCLTVTSLTPSGFTADVMPETMSRTNLGSLSPGSRVNLERAMRADGRFGGHIVSGHIDGTGKIERLEKDENAVRISITAPDSILRLIIEKGSICIDGISLTVTQVGSGFFGVSVIPHTSAQTTLTSKRRGDIVNLENDIVGKYVSRLMGFEKAPPEENKKESRITLEFLAENGF